MNTETSRGCQQAAVFFLKKIEVPAIVVGCAGLVAMPPLLAYGFFKIVGEQIAMGVFTFYLGGSVVGTVCLKVSEYISTRNRRDCCKKSV